MRIDIHTHAWLSHGAKRAVQALSRGFGLQCEASGVLDDLVNEERKADMDRACVLCCAARGEHVHAVNRFAISLLAKDSLLLPFGTVHPELPSWEEELDFLASAGIGGIKLHPDYQGFRLDDKAMFPLYEAMSGRFCLLAHVGSRQKQGGCKTLFSTPRQLERIAGSFPSLHIIGAHMGGWCMWDDVEEIFAHGCPENLWFDTSNTSFHADSSRLGRLLRILPCDRLVFGSDWPFFRVEGELARLQAVGLSGRQMDDLTSNGERLLKLYYPCLGQ